MAQQDEKTKYQATRFLAELIAKTIPCDQPRRDLLDWHVAEEFWEFSFRWNELGMTSWHPNRNATEAARIYAILFSDDMERWQQALGLSALPSSLFGAWFYSLSPNLRLSHSWFLVALRHMYQTKLARLLYEHLESLEIGMARAELDWATAARMIDEDDVFYNLNLSFAALYSYKDFERRCGCRVWHDAYVPLVRSGLPTGYTRIRRSCGDAEHRFGCVH